MGMLIEKVLRTVHFFFYKNSSENFEARVFLFFPKNEAQTILILFLFFGVQICLIVVIEVKFAKNVAAIAAPLFARYILLIFLRIY